MGLSSRNLGFSGMTVKQLLRTLGRKVLMEVPHFQSQRRRLRHVGLSYEPGEHRNAS